MNTNSLLPTIVVGLIAGAGGVAAGHWAGDTAPPPRVRSDRSDRVERLETEMASLRETLRNTSRMPSPAVTPEPEAAPAAEATEADGLPEFERLRGRVFAWNATAEETARFWELARTSKLLPQLIGRLKAAVKADPNQVAARMQLAQAYVAKLYTVPNGPERGVWAVQAEGQWREVLQRDDTNWEARFSLAFSLSQWPAFLNKTPDAIREFETLRTQQETGRPEPQQARIYVQLVRMYRSGGQPDKAAAALRRGLARHPDDDALQAMVDRE